MLFGGNGPVIAIDKMTDEESVDDIVKSIRAARAESV